MYAAIALLWADDSLQSRCTVIPATLQPVAQTDAKNAPVNVIYFFVDDRACLYEPMKLFLMLCITFAFLVIAKNGN